MKVSEPQHQTRGVTNGKGGYMRQGSEGERTQYSLTKNILTDEHKTEYDNVC